jgi:hypothetical protein
MKSGRGYEVTVIKKEKDNIYLGKTNNLEIKFSSNENLEEGEKHFVHSTEVIETKLPTEAFKKFMQK